MVYFAAFLGPGTLAWAMIAWLIAESGLPTSVWGVATLVYGAAFGVIQISGHRLQPPQIRWQVPSTWVRHRARIANNLVWGAILGPGLLTKNPFAGMWALPLLLGLGGSPTVAGSLVGLVHSATRVAGIVMSASGEIDPISPVAWRPYFHWRYVDGLLLLAVAGGLIAAFFR